ncbi:hypothetical protein IG631_16314 [Alternaria alternata]|nr:hypothetical protein IG631_16314 [Alternaria alternata]
MKPTTHGHVLNLHPWHWIGEKAPNMRLVSGKRCSASTRCGEIGQQLGESHCAPVSLAKEETPDELRA